MLRNTGLVFHEKYFWYDSLNQAFPPFYIEPGANPDRPDIKSGLQPAVGPGRARPAHRHQTPSCHGKEILRVHSRATWKP
ncbi:hypothetical protein MBH78_04905 [Oceanimonas sp. NS1]|nr:hypothetical protein [Oceanimonas sp. NS1]